MAFHKAEKSQLKGRLAISGPAGSGKTYTALAVACAMGQRVAVIDTEKGSASRYADKFGFDVLELESFEPERYVAGIHEAEAAGYDVIVVDSLSHAWFAEGGVLEGVDKKAGKTGNKFTAWADATPRQNALVRAILGCKAHIICTMRSKAEYVLEPNAQGRTVPRKVGMAPIQRDGIEFEFDVFGELTTDHELSITKTRCPALDQKKFFQPGADFAKIFMGWLGEGPPAAPRQSDDTIIKVLDGALAALGDEAVHAALQKVQSAAQPEAPAPSPSNGSPHGPAITKLLADIGESLNPRDVLARVAAVPWTKEQKAVLFAALKARETHLNASKVSP